MKARKAGVEILWLDENRYAVAIDGIVCFVGTLEECERRAANLDAKERPCDTGPSVRALDPLTMRGGRGMVNSPVGRSASSRLGGLVYAPVSLKSTRRIAGEITPASPPAPACH
jgi:hypothetical protein